MSKGGKFCNLQINTIKDWSPDKQRCDDTSSKTTVFSDSPEDAVQETGLNWLESKPLAGGNTASCLPQKALKK